VRYAPSPTGALHLGGARTALFNYLFARQLGGQFLLRIEDTDRARLKPGSVEQIQEGLRWLGLEWDEGPGKGGPFAPYVQSERLPLYHEAALLLVAAGSAYRCFCTPERLEKMRAEQRARKEPERYDRTCARLSAEEAERRAATGERFAVRQRLPQEGETTVHDLILGDVTFKNETLDDHVLLKSDGYPTYHLAFAVDDHESRITHVIRGDGWLPSAPKHLLLIAAFGWEAPRFGHLPLVLGPDRRPLSKRHGARDVLEYREAGYLPEAVVNFTAFLGWSPGTEEEIFDMAGLIERFSLSRVQASPAIANLERLDWLNGQFIRRLPVEELAARIADRMPGVGLDALVPVVPLIQERIRTLADGPGLLEFFFRPPDGVAPGLLVPKGKDAAGTDAALQRAEEAIRGVDSWSGTELEPALRSAAEGMGWKAGDLFMALRVAVTGRTVTPPLIESMVQLGQDEVVRRVEHARKLLAQSG
jgi:glutamyl-tRNA synthetase